jgi:hypothetical protein
MLVTRGDLLCGVARIALCEFGTPFPAAMIRAAVDSVEAEINAVHPEQPADWLDP